MSYSIYLLTCANKDEAKKITEQLLIKRLVVCVKRMPVHSSYLWQGNVNHDDEELLVIESTKEKFDAIDAEVKRLHSYEQYVLTAFEVSKTIPGVSKWLEDEIGG